ncbi:MAG: hypothetical protein WAM50_24610, partial [Pseudolabrys sp.]
DVVVRSDLAMTFRSRLIDSFPRPLFGFQLTELVTALLVSLNQKMIEIFDAQQAMPPTRVRTT